MVFYPGSGTRFSGIAQRNGAYRSTPSSILNLQLPLTSANAAVLILKREINPRSEYFYRACPSLNRHVRTEVLISFSHLNHGCHLGAIFDVQL